MAIKVCLDPGHGGNQRANRGPTGYIEPDGVLDISHKLRKELLSTGKFEVKLTREVDATLSLTERAMIAANWGADMFISEHTNAADDRTAGGSVVFYSIDLPMDRALAAKMSGYMASTLGIRDRGPKTRVLDAKKPHDGYNSEEDYYTVIDVAQDKGVPHVFISEAAFHSNPQEEALLKDEKKRQLIAAAQAKAICEFYGVAYKPAAGTDVVVSRSALELQKALNKLDYKGIGGKVLAEDDSYGPSTTFAVKAFQASMGLLVDGSAGPLTWAKIDDELARLFPPVVEPLVEPELTLKAFLDQQMAYMTQVRANLK